MQNKLFRFLQRYALIIIKLINNDVPYYLQVHYVLTNDELRGVYDESGIVITNEDSDFASFSTFEEYQNYWRTLFPKLTVKKIDDFLAKYINSEEEKTDLKNLYIRFEGDLNMIYEHHFAYDEERVIQMLNQMINSKEIPEFDSFVNERKSSKQKRQKRIAKEMVEAEKEELKSGKKSKKQNKGFDNDDDEVNDISTLQLAVLNKNKGNFDNLISNLEAKYAKKGNKKARR